MQMVKIDREFLNYIVNDADAALMALAAVNIRLSRMKPDDPSRGDFLAFRDLMERAAQKRTQIDRAAARQAGNRDLLAN